MNRIKELRKAKGVSQIEVAKAVNLATTAICNYEVGLRNPKEEHRKSLADYFGVSIGYLMGYEEEQKTGDQMGKINIDNILEDLRQFLEDNLAKSYYVKYTLVLDPDELPKVETCIQANKPKYWNKFSNK